jgi:hypothetical protein
MSRLVIVMLARLAREKSSGMDIEDGGDENVISGYSRVKSPRAAISARGCRGVSKGRPRA